MNERPSPIYDFVISEVNATPRTTSQIARRATAHFGRYISDGSVRRGLMRAQENGIAERLEDLRWVQPEEYKSAKLEPYRKKATKLIRHEGACR